MQMRFSPLILAALLQIAGNDGAPSPSAASAPIPARGGAVAAMYDGFVQGSFSLISARTTAAAGTPAAYKHALVTRYVSERLAWLSNHPRSGLRATAYHMTA